MPGRAEWFIFGLGVGLGFVLANAITGWLIANVSQFLYSFFTARKYIALGVPSSVVIEHEARISKRGIFYACRRGCVICEDLNLPCKEDNFTAYPPISRGSE